MLALAGAGAATAAPAPKGKEAWMSLLYGDNFLLGLRVLGQSIRASGTTRRASARDLGGTAAPTQARPPACPPAV